MAIDFKVKDVMHRILVKFVHAYLPDAQKPYNLRAALQPEIDVHGIASKADVYNIETDPKVIEEGFIAACELIYYLAADGYKIKTPLCNMRIRFPGEYEGFENRLNEGLHPELRMQTSAALREYIAERVQVAFDGIAGDEGIIGEALDEKTGRVDEAATIGNILTIRGSGLKIESDREHEQQMGVFFEPESGLPLKAEAVAVNEPRTLKIVVPASLTAGTEYYLHIFTMSSARTSGHLLKEVRDMKSEFKVTAQA